MNEAELTNIFHELRALADEELDEVLPQKMQQLGALGVRISVEVALEDPEFVDEPTPYTELVQYCRIRLNGVSVYEWEETYWGSHGDGGTGWWVERSDSTIANDVEILLELLDMLPAYPSVPPAS